MISIFAITLLAISVVIISLAAFFLVSQQYSHYNLINDVFSIKDGFSLLNKSENRNIEGFKSKLTRAGLTKKDFNEIVLASIIAGASILALVFILELSYLFNVLLILIGLGIMGLAPFLYLDEQCKTRAKKIDNDLAVFIDLLIIILEGGGGLKNAIDKVTYDAGDVLGKDLIEESKIFKYEVITYGNTIACQNLAQRTDSEALSSIANFIRLSDETGIGVKSIFENQSVEIKQEEMLGIEKKAATMNINITFVMFLFILPAVIAMIVFPMRANVLMPGF